MTNQINMFSLVKHCAYWQIVSKETKTVVFRSMSKKTCNDWLVANYGGGE